MELKITRQIKYSNYNDSKSDAFNILEGLRIYLNGHRFRADIVGNTLNYKRIIRVYSSTAQYRGSILSIFREGRIDIMNNPDKLYIRFIHKLDSLIFISIFCGLVLGFMIPIFIEQTNITYILIGVICSFSVLFIGFLILFLKIQRLIKTAKELI